MPAKGLTLSNITEKDEQLWLGWVALYYVRLVRLLYKIGSGNTPIYSNISSSVQII